MAARAARRRACQGNPADQPDPPLCECDGGPAMTAPSVKPREAAAVCRPLATHALVRGELPAAGSGAVQPGSRPGARTAQPWQSGTVSGRYDLDARDASEPHVDVAVLAPLAIEEAAIVKAIGNCSVYPLRGQPAHLGEIAGQRVLVFRAGAGNASAAVAAERVIATWNPARVLLVGIAGGVQDPSTGMQPGDILLPDQVVGYELAKVTRDGTARRYEVYRPDAELLARARSLRPAAWAEGITTRRPGDPHGRIRPLVHVGPMLAGDKILANRTGLASVRRAWPKAIGIEMEGLGVALAAYQNGPGFLIVRAVSDFADSAKDDVWQEYAAEAAACFAVAVLARASPGTTDRDTWRRGGTATASPGQAETYQGPAIVQWSPREVPRVVRGSLWSAQAGSFEPELGRQLVFEGVAGGARFPVVVHTEPVELLTAVDILVVPQNVYLEMPQHFKASVAAAVAQASARRGSSGEIVADVVGDQLREWMRRYARPGLPVAPATMVATSPGEMAQNHIRRLYHIAIAEPRPDSNDYHIAPTTVAQAVRKVLATARAERSEFDPPLRSVAFPLLGSGRGGLNPAVSFAWLWAALESELRQDSEWEIHFITKHRATAALVAAGLLRSGAIPMTPEDPG